MPHPHGFLQCRLRELMMRLAPGGAGELLARTENRDFGESRNIRRRLKQFSALLRQFTVALPRKVAERVATKTRMEWLWVLDDPPPYSAQTGLAHLLGDVEDDPACCII